MSFKMHDLETKITHVGTTTCAVLKFKNMDETISSFKINNQISLINKKNTFKINKYLKKLKLKE